MQLRPCFFFLLRANQCFWLPVSYQFCNFLVLAVGVGAVVAQTDHAISELVSCRCGGGGYLRSITTPFYTTRNATDLLQVVVFTDLMHRSLSSTCVKPVGFTKLHQVEVCENQA